MLYFNMIFLAYIYENIFRHFNEITWTRSSNSFSSSVSWTTFESVFSAWRRFFRHDDNGSAMLLWLGIPHCRRDLGQYQLAIAIKTKKKTVQPNKKLLVTICYTILFFTSADIWISACPGFKSAGDETPQSHSLSPPSPSPPQWKRRRIEVKLVC